MLILALRRFRECPFLAKGHFFYHWSRVGAFSHIVIGLFRAFAQVVFGDVYVLQAGKVKMRGAKVEMLRYIRRIGDMNVVDTIENTQTDNHVFLSGRDAILPLTDTVYYAFHVMVWSASNDNFMCLQEKDSANDLLSQVFVSVAQPGAAQFGLLGRIGRMLGRNLSEIIRATTASN